MKKLLKILGAIIFFLIILIILIPILFKGKILKIAEEEINNMVEAQVSIGDLSISLIKNFPNLSVSLNNLSVIGKDVFEGDTLIAFDKFSATADLISVIAGDEIKVKAIELNHPVLRGKVLNEGAANWDIMPESSDEEDEAVEEETESSGGFKLALKRFAIINADIIYDDQQGNMFAQIKDLNFHLKGDFTDDFTTLATALGIDEVTMKMDGIKYLNKANIAFDAEIDADLANSKFTFRENVFSLNAIKLALNGWVEMKENGYDMDVKLDLLETKFKEFLSLVPAIYAADFKDLEAKGALTIEVFAKGFYDEKNELLPSFNVSFKVMDAMFKYPELPSSAENINIHFVAENSGGSADNTIVDLKKFHVELASNPFDMTLMVKNPVSDPNIKAGFVGSVDFASLSDIVPLDDMKLSGNLKTNMELQGTMSMLDNEQYDKFVAKGSFELNQFKYISPDLPEVTIQKSLFNFSPEFLNLANFDVKIGRSDLHLNGKISNYLQYVFKEETVKAEFVFTSNLLDVNEFMPEEEAETVEEEAVEDTAVVTAFEVPENIDFVLQTELKKVYYDNLEIDNINGLITLRNSKAYLENLSMETLGGDLKLSGYYETIEIAEPKVDFAIDLNNIEIPETYKAFMTVQKLAPVAENCQGNVSGSLSLDATLDHNMEPISETVNSEGSLMTKNIALTNSSTIEKLTSALKAAPFDDLNVKDVAINYRIENGTLTVEPFETELGGVKTNISGSQNIIDQTLDFVFNMNLPKSKLGGGAQSVVDGLVSQAGDKGIDIDAGELLSMNALITGAITNPNIKLEMGKQEGGSVKEQVTQVLEQKKEELLKQASQEARKKADKILAEADAKAKKVVSEAKKNADKIRTEGKNAGKKIRDEGKKQGDALIKKAGNNPIQKKVAKESAKKLNQEADKKADKVENEANNKANKLENEAKSQAKKINDTAKKQADAIIKG